MMRQSNILDPIHNSLPADVWNHPASPEPVLKHEHARWITHFIHEILERGGYTNPQDWLHLVLTGSLTTFQYSNTSDCDVSLFIDSDHLPEWSRAEMIGLMIDGTDGVKLPGTPYEMQCYVVAQGLKPHDLYKPGLRSGYDIGAGTWIVPPDPNRVHDVKAEENGFYVWAMEQADKMERLLRYEPDKAVDFYHQIHRKRMRDQTAGKGDYCLAPNTRILTDHNEWVRLDQLRVGDTIVGFDEEVEGGRRRGAQRKLRRATVTSLDFKILPSYRVSTDSNPDVVASAGHMWLVRGPKRLLEWRRTDQLCEGDQIIRFGTPWGSASDPVEAAYLAGLMDGEGHIAANGRVFFTQKEGLVMERAKQAFGALGFGFGVNRRTPDSQYEYASSLQMYGGVPETMRFLYQVPSVRLRAQRPDFWLGRDISPKNRYVVEGVVATVTGLTDLGEHGVVAIGTSTKTLIAEGLYSHNSESNIIYKFLANRGLFPQIAEASGEHVGRISQRPPRWSEDDQQWSPEWDDEQWPHDWQQAPDHSNGFGYQPMVEEPLDQPLNQRMAAPLPKSKIPIGQMTPEQRAEYQAAQERARIDSLNWLRDNPRSPENIVSHWHQTTPEHRAQGMSWYQDANQAARQIAQDRGITVNQAAGLIANYSPQQHWATNLEMASRAAAGELIGGPKQPGQRGFMASRSQADVAARILNGEDYHDIFRGKKIASFGHLIEHGQDTDPNNPMVVVDRHALGVAHGGYADDGVYIHSKVSAGVRRDGSSPVYDEVANMYKQAADIINVGGGYDGVPVQPHQLQAATWLTRQRLNAEGGYSDTNPAVAERTRKVAEGSIRNWNAYAAENHPTLVGQIPGTGFSAQTGAGVGLEPAFAKTAAEQPISAFIHPDYLAWRHQPEEEYEAQRWAAWGDHQSMLDANAGQDLQGLPGPVNVPSIGPLHFHANADIQRIANEYNQANGLGPHPTDYSTINPEISAQIAQEYERMQHNPADPETAAAYQALANETRAQYAAAVRNGYTFEFYPEHDPYPHSPREAVLDLYHNKHMYVYPTVAGYGQDQQAMDHPLLGDSGVRWNGQPVTHNDLFRAVHDFYGHAKEGLGFRALGEDNAYRQHAAMFSPQARRALTSETRGQNSYVNYGPFGSHNQRANQLNTVYAPQKAGLLPEWVTDPNLHTYGLSRTGSRIHQDRASMSDEHWPTSYRASDRQSSGDRVSHPQPRGRDGRGAGITEPIRGSEGPWRMVPDQPRTRSTLGGSRTGESQQADGASTNTTTQGHRVVGATIGGWSAIGERDFVTGQRGGPQRQDPAQSSRRDGSASEQGLHYADSVESVRTSGETRTQLLQLAQQLPQDQSKVIHEFPDGWTMRELQTYGDAHREGNLMGNCLTWQSHSPNPIWEYHPQAEWKAPLDEAYDDDEVDEEERVPHLPENANYQLPLPMYAYPKSTWRLYSLRDPDNLPHASIDTDGSDPALGRHNSPLKPEYLQRIEAWQDAKYGPGNWEDGDNDVGGSWGRISNRIVGTVNFGPYGQQNQNAPQGNTVYAEQKAGLLPEWVSDPNLHAQGVPAFAP